MPDPLVIAGAVLMCVALLLVLGGRGGVDDDPPTLDTRNHRDE